MSTSDLFVIRHKLLNTSFGQFKRTIEGEASKMDPQIFQNLALEVYLNEKYRKTWMDYLLFLTNYRPAILHIEVAQGRRMLEDLLLNGKLKEVRDLLGLMVNSKAGLEGYSLVQLGRLVLDRKNTSETLSFFGQLLAVRKYFFNGGEVAEGERDDGLLVRNALERDLLAVGVELLQRRVGRLGTENEELFQLAKLKVGKRENDLLLRFVELYLEATRCNPRKTNAYGQTFLDHIPSKQLKERLETIIVNYEQRFPPIRKQQQTRRSQNKVRSSMGLGENPKQYSTQALQGGGSSKQKMTISIQNMQDELSIQKEAGKIYQKHIQEKEKYYRYEKMQSREGQGQGQGQGPTRVGIIKSQELRYYLEADIQYQVAKIKEENNRYRQCFVDVLNRIRQKLTNTLNIQLEVFGSFQTSLCLLESDIDIVAVPNSLSGEVDRLTFLGEIKNILESMRDEIETVNFITTASVPIIKVICTANYGHKKIDITKKTEEHNGLESVKLIKEYLSLYPPLESLTFILKKFIYVSGLSAPYKGGISSYALVLMIVAYMQNEYKSHQLGKGKGELLVADLLIGFLKFYGFKMNYVMKAICLFDIHNPASWKNYAGCLSPYTDPKNPAIDLQPKLVIIDPLNDSNNVGRATHKIKQIQMAFEIAYICIHTFRQCGRKRRCESFKRISRGKVEDVRFTDNVRPCCILRRMFACTEKFIKE